MSIQWNAVVLAGDRGPSDPVACSAKVAGKAFATIQGKSLLERTLSVLVECESIGKIFTVGPQQKDLANYPHINSYFNQHNIEYIEPAMGPSASALRGVKQSNYYPTMIVTCDLALINVEAIESFCRKMNDVEADFVAGAIDFQQIHKMIPTLKKTEYKFVNQSVCFANTFALLAPQGLRALEYWQDVENSRKKPLELIRKIDWLSVFKYKLGRLSLDQVALKLSAKVGADLKIESIAYPELAIDIDSAIDYKIMQDYFPSL